jgi:DNA-binding transcriptional LysR family regulator
MELRHLKAFRAVASTLNITRAPEQVHLSQSSATEQIQALEADLGTALFDRSRRRLQLTEAGQRLLEYAGDLLAVADQAGGIQAEDLAGEPFRSLRRAASTDRCSKAHSLPDVPAAHLSPAGSAASAPSGAWWRPAPAARSFPASSLPRLTDALWHHRGAAMSGPFRFP